MMADEPRVFVRLAGDAAPRQLQVIVRAGRWLVQQVRREVSDAAGQAVS
jgi:hypothetical protein